MVSSLVEIVAPRWSGGGVSLSAGRPREPVTRPIAAWFCDLAALYVGALAVEESIWIARENSSAAGEQPDHQALDEQLTAFLESLPAGQFPFITGTARELPLNRVVRLSAGWSSVWGGRPGAARIPRIGGGSRYRVAR